MGATYTRQSSYTDGDVITAAHTNDEFNQLLAAFAASTGHTHDGTTAEGGPITKLLGNTLTFGAGTAGTDITITFDGETSDGVLKWMEDEDYFEFSDDILVASTEKVQFRDTAIFINSSADGQLDLVADTEIQLAATTVDLNGNLDVSGSLTLGGTAITSTAAELNILDGVTATASELNILDGVTATAAEINILDGVTATATELNILDGVTATTAELNIMDGVTSTATELNLVDGSSAGTVVNSKAVIYGSAGEVNATTLQIAGTSITATATELNLLDGVTATTAELNILDGVTSTASELNLVDGITAGTVSASKAVIVDSNKDITGFRNVSITGDLTVAGDDITMGTNTSGNLLVADGTNFNSIAVGDLSEISTIANDDVFLAVDTSGGGLKKVARSTVVSGLAVSGAISNVVEDTTPQLGGDLDVNGNGLVSTSNGNIALTPNGSGVVRIDGSNGIDMESGAISIKNAGAESYVRFYCEVSNAHYTQLQAAPHSAYTGNVTVVLPASADTLVGRATTDTLTNKTLTTPVITEIDSGSTITLDATTDIVLDADGGDVTLKDGGTTFGNFNNSSGELVIQSGSTPTTAITMSGANVTVAGNLTVSGTTTTVDSTTVNIQNAFVFEGATDDAHETTLTTVDPTADRTISLPNQSGTLPVLAVASTTQITSTPEELNIMDGGTSASSTTLADADRLVTNDDGTMKQVALTDVKTYLSSAGFSTDDATALAIALG